MKVLFLQCVYTTLLHCCAAAVYITQVWPECLEELHARGVLVHPDDELGDLFATENPIRLAHLSLERSILGADDLLESV